LGEEADGERNPEIWCGEVQLLSFVVVLAHEQAMARRLNALRTESFEPNPIVNPSGRCDNPIDPAGCRRVKRL
jgi:hypothetical protein